MKPGSIAALIRGFCIDLTGKPQTVVFQEWDGECPSNALKFKTDSEEAAAVVIRSAYETWKKSNPATGGGIPLPSCAALTDNGKTQAVFWIDNDIDSARARLSEKDDSARIETPAAANPVIGPAERADVVKNRIALVTGGAQGIGEEIVRNLACARAFVFIADLNLEGARRLADKINNDEKRTAA